MEALKKLAKWYCSFNMDPNFSLQIWIAEVSYINTKNFRQVKMTWKGLKVLNLLKWIHQQQGVQTFCVELQMNYRSHLSSCKFLRTAAAQEDWATPHPSFASATNAKTLPKIGKTQL
jgi:hypothetical protein